MTGPRALAGVMFAAATALAAGAASAQVPYQIGNYSGSVTVDNGVLESLGPTPTVPEMLRPGTPVGEYGYDPRMGSLAAIEGSRGSHGVPRAAPTPSLGIDGSPAPDWLRRPDAQRYAPLPETLSKPVPAAKPATTAPRASAPTLTPPAVTQPKPAPAARSTPAPAPRAAEPAPRVTPPSPPATARVVAPAPPPPPKPSAPAATAPAPRVAAPAAVAPAAPPPPKLPPVVQEPPKREPQTQVAAAPPPPPAPPPSVSSQAAGGDLVRVPFEANQTALAGGPRPELDALVTRLRKDETLRVQLLAYADGDEENANKARRLSLSRALAVRAYLIDKQIQSTRMDVRALGNRAKDTPKDRVDVVLVSR